jgi:hypothetical protein
MEYRILASLRDELNQGWVWVTNPGFESRSVVRITNKKTNKSVYCECLEIDENYLSFYNNAPRESIDKSKATITISAWYRKKLGGINTKSNQELEIRAANGWHGKLLANLHHPQVVVRMATWLALISLGLGILGLLLGLK